MKSPNFPGIRTLGVRIPGKFGGRWLDEFKEFVSKGDVVMVAVGLVLGLYSKASVDTVLAGVINPLIAALFGAENLESIGFRHR